MNVKICYNNLASIVCCDKNYGIGWNNKIPWLDKKFLKNNSELKSSVKKDLQHFKNTRELYNYLVVGRKTFASLPYLDNSRFITITSNRNKVKGIIENQVKYFSSDINQFLFDLVHKFFKGNLLCIGGESIYKKLIPYSSVLYLTQFKDRSFSCNKFVDRTEIEKFNNSILMFEDENIVISRLTR